MKKTILHTLSYLFALGICLFPAMLFGRVLLVYTVPMRDDSYNLSLYWEGEAIPDGWQYDQKGWTVFTQEEKQKTLLAADGMGGFTGLQKPGQTFYFSRTLSETLDSPTLRLDTANQSIAVFLDGELLYTDCPELDNRIGYLALPTLDWDRTEPTAISLPLNYQGKTLTVAQSTGLGEKQEPEADAVVRPCGVMLYCGYSYEMAETKLLAQQYEAAQAGFENLRRHHEEVMMLQHDMKKHLTFLRQSISDKAAVEYLDSLIGQQQALSPVVQSRNQTLDIILNAKLGEAAGKGIAVEVIQVDAPKSLPLPDADLCALMMNLLDNAIHAASLTEKPFLRLDMHQKDGFFVFVCENAAAPEPPEKSTAKKTVQQHGLGMKIMEQILNRHGNMMTTERLSGSYRITIAIALVTLSNNA